MSVRMRSPFKVMLRLDEARAIDPEKVSLKQLRDVVAGRDMNFPRPRAMDLLQVSDFPNKHRDFEAILENEHEPSDIRYLAAVNLWRINTPNALEILIKNSQVCDERVLEGIMMALGRIGGRSALNAVLKVKKNAQGRAALQAKFAADLISYRLGLNGNELQVPDEKDYMKLPSENTYSFQFTPAKYEDSELCLRSLAHQPFGIEFSEHPMYQMRCGRNDMIMLFNREFISQNAVKKLTERRSFLGVIAIKSEESQLYSTTLLVLTSPTRQSDKVNILIYRSTGDLAFGGIAEVKNSRAVFSIRTISRPGASPIKVEGVFEDGKLEIENALSSSFAQKRRQPTKN